ncbi:MAG: hypothetical protein AAGB04_22615 [Pseudomonadota bacterium]
MAQPQYTPAQVLETARRAEANGQLDYADQAFRHIIEFFPSSPEASMARDAIASRQQFQSTAGDRLQDRPLGANDGLQQQSRIPPQATVTSQPSPLPHTGQQPLNGLGNQNIGSQAGNQRAGNNLQLEPVAGAEAAGRGAGFAPPHHRNYPLGRFLATIMIFLGMLTLIVSLIVGATSVVNPATAQVLTGTRLLIPNILYSLSIFGSGLILCLVGLIAHAVFHTARNLTTYTTAEHARLRRRDT